MSTLIVNEHADILAALLAGKSEYAISRVYFEFTNTNAATPTPLVTGGHSYYDGLDGTNYDFVRVTLDNTAALSASSGAYTQNVATFLAATSGAVGYKGATFSQTAGSKVLGVALVSSPTGNFADELVFARIYFDSPISKLDGQDVGVRVPLTFTV